MKPDIYIRTSGYETTTLLLKKMVSLAKDGYRVAYITPDSVEMLEYRLNDLMLHDKPDMKDQVLLNKRLITVPNDKGREYISETYGDRMRFYHCIGLSMNTFIQNLRDLEVVDHIIIDTLNTVTSTQGYETREAWKNDFVKRVEGMKNVEITATEYRDLKRGNN